MLWGHKALSARRPVLGSGPVFLRRPSRGRGVSRAREAGWAWRQPDPQNPQCPWSRGPPGALLGGRKAEGQGWRGPVGAADKRLLTMGLSGRGSPNWFVSGAALTPGGAARAAEGSGRGPAVHHPCVRVPEAPGPG